MKNANPVFRAIRAGHTWALAALLALAGCEKGGAAGRAASVPSPPAGGVARYSYEVVKARPHDRGAFTQGLVFHRGSLLESTGLNGQSTLREVDVETGRIRKQVALPAAYFAEGLAVIGDRAYQLTWQHRKGFIYDADTFQAKGEFAYEGEGWGLTTDGRELILSDGTDRIRFLDPATFAVTRSISVTRDGRPLRDLNELEFVHGHILANVWQTEEVVLIDPATGVVRGIVDFSNLLPRAERSPDTDVLNGIAYDPTTDRLLVTGKRWPHLYEVRLVLRK